MTILIIDDEERIRLALAGLLEEEGYDITHCGSAEEGLERLKQDSFDIAFLDVMLPGMDGLTVLPKIKKAAPEIKVLMMSGHADLSMAVEATRLGADNFFEKPLNPDQVILSVRNIARQHELERKVASLENQFGGQAMIGEAPVMMQLKSAIERAAPTDGRVLVLGENGTGKELVARAVHAASLRQNRPFISLNCAALPKDLVESELFGYEKGAFTGALKRKAGRFEMAHTGTLFLDEVGDMGLDTQAKLLRVLQENEAIRVGGEKPYRFDVRIVAATNKRLDQEIEAGRFREDLFYRLNVIPLTVPPLRERKRDIPLLAAHFLDQLSQTSGLGRVRFEPGCDKLMQAYAWPGNVRELKNIVERLAIMSDHQLIRLDRVAEVLHMPAPEPETKNAFLSGERSLKELVSDFEKDVLLEGYKQTRGNVSELSRLLKTDRANLHRKLKGYGIK